MDGGKNQQKGHHRRQSSNVSETFDFTSALLGLHQATAEETQQIFLVPDTETDVEDTGTTDEKVSCFAVILGSGAPRSEPSIRHLIPRLPLEILIISSYGKP